MSHLLIIGYVWPEPASSAAGKRMMELITLFQEQDWKITFATPATRSDFMVDLKAINVDEVAIELNNSDFDVFIADLKPDIVLFDRFMMEEQFGWRVAKHCPDALRILDTEDLHCLRKARHNALKEKRAFDETDLFNDTSKREIASIFRSDLSLIISKNELELLTKFFKVPSTLIYYLPFLIDSLKKTDKKNWLGFHKRQHFITIGNFLHEPNQDAVLYLKTTIWPLIKKELPKAEMHVYGAYVSSKTMQLHNPKEDFYIKGRAESVDEVMRTARVCLAPLRFGAGLKGKFTDAMKNGTPSITTAIGAEGMHGELPWGGFIADEVNDIVRKAVKLYTSESDWLIAQQNGFEIINQYYNKEILGNELVIHLKTLQKNIEKHRLHNFTGAMLMHHTMNSTKFMSKWIEEKNKTRS
ncbi:glycosyltransferase [Flavobacteriaceae bacterium R38]|nr:glycosyltransferase [Flavobacteriaceae bacterium R38]